MDVGHVAGGANLRAVTDMRVILGIALASILCACATKFQPQGATGGFSESWQAPDRVLIEFHGNHFTSAMAARDMAILRAADLARDKGFDHFAVAREGDASDSTYSSGWTSPSGRTWDEGVVTKPGTRLIVQMLHGVAPGSNVYDVEFVESTMGPKYR